MSRKAQRLAVSHQDDPSLVTLEFQGVEAGKVKLDGGEITVPQDMRETAQSLVQTIFDLADEIKDLQDILKGKEGEIAGLKAKLDQQDDADRLDALVREREELLAAAESLGFKKDEFRPLKAGDIKLRLVSKRLGPSFKADGVDPKFVEGVWQVIRADIQSSVEKQAKQAKLGSITSPQRRQDEYVPSSPDDRPPSYAELARQKMEGLHGLTQEQIKQRGLN